MKKGQDKIDFASLQRIPPSYMTADKWFGGYRKISGWVYICAARTIEEVLEGMKDFERRNK